MKTSKIAHKRTFTGFGDCLASSRPAAADQLYEYARHVALVFHYVVRGPATFPCNASLPPRSSLAFASVQRSDETDLFHTFRVVSTSDILMSTS